MDVLLGSYVLAHRQDFADIFARCSIPAAGAGDLARSLDAALRLLSDDQEQRPLDCKIKNLLDEIRSKRQELQDRREALEAVRGISVLHERIKTAREDLRAGRFIEAAIAARGLKSDFPESEERRGENEPVVFGLLRKELADCFDELQEVLAKNDEKFDQFEPANSRVIVKSSISAGEVSQMELRVVIKKMEFSSHITWSPLDEKIPPLRKFRKLAGLYHTPLKSITTEWETGELQNCGFTLLEVKNFVKAIFQDLSLRKECLLRIGNSS